MIESLVVYKDRSEYCLFFPKLVSRKLKESVKTRYTRLKQLIFDSENPLWNIGSSVTGEGLQCLTVTERIDVPIFY